MRTITDILANGKTTRSKVKVVTFIRTVRSTTGNGQEIKSLEMAHTSTRMEMCILEGGRMTDDREKGR